MKNFTTKMALLGTILFLGLNLTLKAQTLTVDSVSTVIGITNTTAFTGGWVTTDQVVTERGVCYGTTDNPTVDDNKVPSWKSSPTVPYEPAYLEGLTPNTTYYVRAYATTDNGTVYSASKSFTTTNNAEVLWQLEGSTGFSPAITGPLTAQNMWIDDLMGISGWDKNNGKAISVGEDFLKIRTQRDDEGANTLNDSSLYFEFNVSPMTGINYTVKQLKMVIGGYKTGAANIVLKYSLDGFNTEDSLGITTLDDKNKTTYRGTASDPIKPGSFSLDDEFAEMGHQFISTNIDLNIPVGKTLTIRMYIYGKHGITALMKDIVLAGEVTDATTAGTATIDSVSTPIGITNTTAYTGSWVNDQASDLSEVGICYSTSENPTILDNRFPAWKYSPLVAFEPAYLEGLEPNTTYYVRAYGINASGESSYSPQKSFTTTDNNAEIMWPLSDFRQFAAVKSGAVIASDMSIDTSARISGWDKNNGRDISIGEDYLKIQPQGGDLGADFNPDVYFGFNIYPNASNVKMTVKQINMVVAGYKTGGATIAYAYSLDGFATEDSLGIATLDNKDMEQHRGTVTDPVKPGSGSLDDATAEMGGQFISFDTDIDVPAGKILSIRMYAWSKNGLTLLMKDVVISAETVETTDPLSSDALLTNITLDPDVDLSPAFDSNTFSYTAELPAGTTTVDPSVTKSNIYANVDGSGAVDVSAGAGVSQITVTSEDGATTNVYLITYTVVQNTAVKDVAAKTGIYPNPANSIIHVESASVIDNIKIVSITGSVVSSYAPHAQTHVIDVSNIKNGLYIMVVKTAEGTEVSRIVINK